MSERHWTGSVLATTALALPGAVAGASCGHSASTGHASATETAGVAAATGPSAYTARQLKSALLTRVSGARPAAATFRVGRDGVSEVLVSATSQLAATALSDKLPAGCAHYTATVDGKTFSYSVREATLSGLRARRQATGPRRLRLRPAITVLGLTAGAKLVA